MRHLAELLKQKKELLGQVMTKEMGKPNKTKL
jgi:hypothetical protein